MKPNVSKWFKTVKSSAVKHGPEILTAVGIVGMIYMYFRIFSRNIAKRSVENQKFCNMRYDLAIKKNKWKKCIS